MKSRCAMALLLAPAVASASDLPVVSLSVDGAGTMLTSESELYYWTLTDPPRLFPGPSSILYAAPVCNGRVATAHGVPPIGDTWVTIWERGGEVVVESVMGNVPSWLAGDAEGVLWELKGSIFGLDCDGAESHTKPPPTVRRCVKLPGRLRTGVRHCRPGLRAREESEGSHVQGHFLNARIQSHPDNREVLVWGNPAYGEWLVRRIEMGEHAVAREDIYVRAHRALVNVGSDSKALTANVLWHTTGSRLVGEDLRGLDEPVWLNRYGCFGGDRSGAIWWSPVEDCRSASQPDTAHRRWTVAPETLGARLGLNPWLAFVLVGDELRVIVQGQEEMHFVGWNDEFVRVE